MPKDKLPVNPAWHPRHSERTDIYSNIADFDSLSPLALRYLKSQRKKDPYFGSDYDIYQAAHKLKVPQSAMWKGGVHPSMRSSKVKTAALTRREQRDLKSYERASKYNPVATGAVGAAAGSVLGPLLYGTILRPALGGPPLGRSTIAKAALIGAGLLGTRTALSPSLSRKAAAKLRRKERKSLTKAAAEVINTKQMQRNVSALDTLQAFGPKDARRRAESLDRHGKRAKWGFGALAAGALGSSYIPKIRGSTLARRGLRTAAVPAAFLSYASSRHPQVSKGYRTAADVAEGKSSPLTREQLAKKRISPSAYAKGVGMMLNSKRQSAKLQAINRHLKRYEKQRKGPLVHAKAVLNPGSSRSVSIKSTPEEKTREANRISEILLKHKKRGTLSLEGERMLSGGHSKWGDKYGFYPDAHIKKASEREGLGPIAAAAGGAAGTLFAGGQVGKISAYYLNRPVVERLSRELFQVDDSKTKLWKDLLAKAKSSNILVTQAEHPHLGPLQKAGLSTYTPGPIYESVGLSVEGNELKFHGPKIYMSGVKSAPALAHELGHGTGLRHVLLQSKPLVALGGGLITLAGLYKAYKGLRSGGEERDENLSQARNLVAAGPAVGFAPELLEEARANMRGLKIIGPGNRLAFTKFMLPSYGTYLTKHLPRALSAGLAVEVLRRILKKGQEKKAAVKIAQLSKIVPLMSRS